MCSTLTLAPLYLDFKRKSDQVWLKLNMDSGLTKKSLGLDQDPRKIKNADLGPGLDMAAAAYSCVR